MSNWVAQANFRKELQEVELETGRKQRYAISGETPGGRGNLTDSMFMWTFDPDSLLQEQGTTLRLTIVRCLRAGVMEQWSKGPVEGFVNKLKLVNCQGYGRAGFELLRARVLAA